MRFSIVHVPLSQVQNFGLDFHFEVCLKKKKKKNFPATKTKPQGRTFYHWKRLVILLGTITVYWSNLLWGNERYVGLIKLAYKIEYIANSPTLTLQRSDFTGEHYAPHVSIKGIIKWEMQAGKQKKKRSILPRGIWNDKNASLLMLCSISQMGQSVRWICMGRSHLMRHRTSNFCNIRQVGQFAARIC